MAEKISRRDLLTKTGHSALGAGLMAAGVACAAPRPPEDAAPQSPRPDARPFGLCLNTSTLRGHRLGIVEELELAAKTGYQGVELWVSELDEFEKGGGSLADLGKRIKDLNLVIPDAIAFPEWMVEDPQRRAKGMEDARRRMEQAAKIGCPRIAAPPAGDVKGVDLLRAAERYRDLLELGEKLGVVPAVEVWGFSPAIFRLGQAALVALESGHPAACILPDVFHLHRGGSGLAGIRHLRGESISIFHVNDYPAQPPREELRDSHRVFTGDGIAPLPKLLKDLQMIGYRGMLSLELFNADYWKRPAADVAREGLEKLRAVVRSSLG
jgi:sugar phosphate isomerase/epimerase